MIRWLQELIAAIHTGSNSRKCYQSCQNIECRHNLSVRLWCLSFSLLVCVFSPSVPMRLSLCVYLFFSLLPLCPFISSAAGRLRSLSCPFWSFLGVITKGYVPQVSTAKRALVSRQKNLCYVTHWFCCCWCCFWQWSRAVERQGLWGWGAGESDGNG